MFLKRGDGGGGVVNRPEFILFSNRINPKAAAAFSLLKSLVKPKRSRGKKKMYKARGYIIRCAQRRQNLVEFAEKLEISGPRLFAFFLSFSRYAIIYRVPAKGVCI